MFADDTKIYREVQDLEDCQLLQDDLNVLSSWSSQWLLDFSATKCVVMRIKKALNYLYTLNGTYLGEVQEQKDLGVIISNDLKPSKHIQAISSKARQRAGMINRCFQNLTSTKVSTLYKAIIRPVLEYASPVWNPWLAKDITKLEKVQKRCIKFVNNDFKPLKSRRLQADLIDTYKYLNGLYKTPADKFFTLATGSTRGHKHKLFKTHSRTDVHKYFFSQRVIDVWNKLPKDLAESKTLEVFKKKLRSLP